jgi:hypothetical protein
MVAGTDARGQEVVGQSAGPVVELAIGQPTTSRDHRLVFGDGVCHQLEQITEIECPRRSCRIPSILTYHQVHASWWW